MAHAYTFSVPVLSLENPDHRLIPLASPERDKQWNSDSTKNTEYTHWCEEFRNEMTAEQSPYFKTFMEPRNNFQEMKSASLCSLAGRYDNTIPTRFLAP
jgi:hypothetical protein